jgi:hypothetical protein
MMVFSFFGGEGNIKRRETGSSKNCHGELRPVVEVGRIEAT